MADADVANCWLCARPLGSRLEYHHPVPKSRGGRVTAAVHPICHRTLHKTFSNKELEAMGLATLRDKPEIARFLAWIANKDPDFHAPTHKGR